MGHMTKILSAILICLTVIAEAKKQYVIFAVIGDWGWGPDGDQYKSKNNQTFNYISQLAVGKALGRQCANSGCEFVINNGDNFYNLGINKGLGVSDPQWITSFENVYNHSSLQKIKFYGVLGNHDYGIDSPSTNHSVYPQMEYTFWDPKQRWTIPYRYYALDVPNVFHSIRITTVDTSPFLDSYCSAPGTYHTPELVLFCKGAYRNANLNLLKRSLARAKAKKQWSIVIGHHPLVSAADGEYSPLNRSVGPILAAEKPQLWFNGHDHAMSHAIYPAAPKTNFFTIGSSGIASEDDVPTSSSILKYLYGNSDHGFAIVKLYSKNGEILFYGIDDVTVPNAVATLKYRYKFNK